MPPSAWGGLSIGSRAVNRSRRVADCAGADALDVAEAAPQQHRVGELAAVAVAGADRFGEPAQLAPAAGRLVRSTRRRASRPPSRRGRGGARGRTPVRPCRGPRRGARRNVPGARRGCGRTVRSGPATRRRRRRSRRRPPRAVCVELEQLAHVVEGAGGADDVVPAVTRSAADGACGPAWRARRCRRRDRAAPDRWVTSTGAAHPSADDAVADDRDGRARHRHGDVVEVDRLPATVLGRCAAACHARATPRRSTAARPAADRAAAGSTSSRGGDGSAVEHSGTVRHRGAAAPPRPSVVGLEGGLGQGIAQLVELGRIEPSLEQRQDRALLGVAVRLGDGDQVVHVIGCRRPVAGDAIRLLDRMAQVGPWPGRRLVTGPPRWRSSNGYRHPFAEIVVLSSSSPRAAMASRAAAGSSAAETARSRRVTDPAMAGEHLPERIAELVGHRSAGGLGRRLADRRSLDVHRLVGEEIDG